MSESAQLNRGQELHMSHREKAIYLFGDLYQVNGQNPIEFCYKAWNQDKIPLLYGQKQIGKTGILGPYLKDKIAEATIIEAPSYDDTLAFVPHKMIYFCSIHGEDRDAYINQIISQTKNDSKKLKILFDKYELGEIDIDINSEGINRLLDKLSNGNYNKLSLPYLKLRLQIPKAIKENRPIGGMIKVLRSTLGKSIV